ncbi:MAG: aspartate aminotransferase family protein [Candidatus Helarchaeota archaeon]|nr:aspartate aminotransferase family protein [Candidatus Helarchaeota archaeon]
MTDSTYEEKLSKILTFFQAPTSNRIMDGYFIFTISHFLDYFDDLKSEVPIFGGVRENIDELYKKALELKMPEKISNLETIINQIIDYCKGMYNWSHQNAMMNVIGPPPISGIIAKIAGCITNANIVSDEYSHKLALAEIEAVSMLCNLIGYDSKKSGGVFTFGGTGTNLYGIKIGLEKCAPGTFNKGLQNTKEKVKIFASDCAHYTKYSCAQWLGIGSDNVVIIPTSQNNDMLLDVLDEKLRETIDAGQKIACITATEGTTDAFGIDNMKGIVKIRDKMVKDYNLSYTPHIHADAVIGWIWAVFNDYDFESNPLGFKERTLASLVATSKLIKDLSLSDTVGIDFHKTGYAPYISSLILIKNRADLNLISRDTTVMPYLYQTGQYHPGIFTLECSRDASGPINGMANLKLLGKEGYRVIIGHVVEMAELLRDKLESYEFIDVLNDYNYGSVTLFRVYPDGIKSRIQTQKELKDPVFAEDLIKYNKYNRKIFDYTVQKAYKGEGVALSFTEAYRHTTYDSSQVISAIKSFIMSPFTNKKSIDKVVEQVLEAREKT